ncbi:MAG: NADH-ubiquinone oxidoreductase-F iron-sulfur binding region domain-containing protein [Desulfomonilaceae bacterium]
MTIEELQDIGRIEKEKQEGFKHRINVCVAAGCLSCQSGLVKESLEKEVSRRGLESWCQVKGVGCLGLCSSGPLVAIDSDGILYKGVEVSDASDIVEALGGSPIKRLECSLDQPFFKKRQRIVLENCGKIDPESIEDYISERGYEALYTALRLMSPNEVINEVVKSGLRGRGGAGFPTGLKWTTVSKASGPVKFVVCNADEGDPGAFMDRSVLESDPHRVLEGMAIAAVAVGASYGFIYVRAEYPLAVKRIRTAIARAERLGVLGHNIFNTTFSFDVKVRLGAGAFVCGEETALLASIEGRRGAPRPRPPYPAEHGLWGYPTLINNVETYANIAPIIRKGGEWFSSIGVGKSKGTKVFALAGHVKNTGLIEVPMGTSLREIVYEIGGGIQDERRFKAVQSGGPSGGCLPDKFLDMSMDYESLAEAGSIMGSGGLIIMDESSCMVDVARFFVEFCMTESCGKCAPCRIGTAQIYNILKRITEGAGKPSDLDLLTELSDLVKNTSLCGLGQTAPNPVLSTMKYFMDEYKAHVEQHTCPSCACRMNNHAEEQK